MDFIVKRAVYITNIIIKAAFDSPIGATFFIQKPDEIRRCPSTVVINRLFRASRKKLECRVSLYVVSPSNTFVLLIIRIYIGDNALALNQHQFEYMFSRLTLLSVLKTFATSVPLDSCHYNSERSYHHYISASDFCSDHTMVPRVDVSTRNKSKGHCLQWRIREHSWNHPTTHISPCFRQKRAQRWQKQFHRNFCNRERGILEAGEVWCLISHLSFEWRYTILVHGDSYGVEGPTKRRDYPNHVQIHMVRPYHRHWTIWGLT